MYTQVTGSHNQNVDGDVVTIPEHMVAIGAASM